MQTLHEFWPSLKPQAWTRDSLQKHQENPFTSTAKCPLESSSLSARAEALPDETDCAFSIVLWSQVRPKPYLKSSFAKLFSRWFSSLFPSPVQEHQPWGRVTGNNKKINSSTASSTYNCLSPECQTWGWPRTKVIKRKTHTGLRSEANTAGGRRPC